MKSVVHIIEDEVLHRVYVKVYSIAKIPLLSWADFLMSLSFDFYRVYHGIKDSIVARI